MQAVSLEKGEKNPKQQDRGYELNVFRFCLLSLMTYVMFSLEKGFAVEVNMNEEIRRI